jgi:hypothetical protein
VDVVSFQVRGLFGMDEHGAWEDHGYAKGHGLAAAQDGDDECLGFMAEAVAGCCVALDVRDVVLFEGR